MSTCVYMLSQEVIAYNHYNNTPGIIWGKKKYSTPIVHEHKTGFSLIAHDEGMALFWQSLQRERAILKVNQL